MSAPATTGAIHGAHDLARGPRRASRAALVAGVVGALMLVAFGAAVGRSAFEIAALGDLSRRSSFAIAGNAAALGTKLQKFRLVPLALSTDAEVVDALAAPDESLRGSLNRRFEEIAAASGAAAIYLVDARGVTFAASNYRAARSFIGENYAFRRYFQTALAHRDGEEFAVGTVSGEPGFYMSRSVLDASGEAIGVVVVKLLFDDIEAYWRSEDRLLLAADEGGRIIVAGDSALRFEMLDAVAEGPSDAPPAALAARFGDRSVFISRRKVDGADWTVYGFEHLDDALRPARNLGAIGGASISALMTGALAFLFYRLARNSRKAAEAESLRRSLERAVKERTRELETSYERLTDETARRQKAQETVGVMREEIAQLNRLAVMGQLSAKVAHEINQPLTAMRNYLDTSTKLLEAGDTAVVQENLRTMSDLVRRAASITAELRQFAKKRPLARNRTAIGKAIDGALLIASPALSVAGVSVDRRDEADSAIVLIDQIRIEQVVLNLLQNAIDALAQTPEGRIIVATSAGDGRVTISISDNGPGVARPDDLFVPFMSTKETGLGLGLSICRDILAEFDGELIYRDNGGAGAAFDIILPSVAK